MSDERRPGDPGAGTALMRMPERSRYAGQPVDMSTRRSIVIRPPEGRRELIEPHDKRVVVDNFYHEERFWRAVIPLDGVQSVFGQAFNFSKPRIRRGKTGPEIVMGKDGLPKRTIPFLYHVQSRFTLKPGQEIRLFGPDDGTMEHPVHLIDDSVYSIEVVGPAGFSFNMRDALAGNLLCAHRFLSTLEMVFERIVVQHEWVVQSPSLPLTPEEKRTVLVKSLLRSHHAGMTQLYYLYRCCGTNNCTSNPFRIVDETVRHRYRLPQRLGSMLYRFPISPRWYLRLRGLDRDPSVRKLVREEFEPYIRDEKTRRRKREYVKRRVKEKRNRPETR